ncbi:hypothetical protein ANCDUO_01704 [Ancylostoma duodenale]|uniref:Rab-GAP TBC domain-containing protein n=1 Tax=Ancylostoma duodenale TaxID=51022 RepID=A0A0C2DY96_9BILA|nr:hypothetical protein ANCDUO_01704 [Ancylostoma duodenale]
MRSMRLFYSNSECTCGQLVIASPDSHYKGSPSACDDKHFLICQPAIKRNELDPEDGLYETVTWDYWKSYKNADGAVNDSTTIRKAIFFASMEPNLRKEIWPFLLRVYPWQSTLEQRETIRNDLFLEYQNLRRKACVSP